MSKTKNKTIKEELRNLLLNKEPNEISFPLLGFNKRGELSQVGDWIKINDDLLEKIINWIKKTWK